MSKFEVYVYHCHCSTCVGRAVYVGKAKHGTLSRHKAHLSRAKAIIEGRSSRSRDLRFDHFMARHGIENVRVSTIASYENEDAMNAGEVFYIQEYQTSIEHGGMNFDRGGRGGRRKGVYKATHETCLKLSQSLKEAYALKTFSDEERLALSIRRKEWWSSLTKEERSNHALKIWNSMLAKATVDNEYAIQLFSELRKRGEQGGNRFLERLEDPEFARAFSQKVSEGVSKWCSENPEACKARARKIVISRSKNGRWAKAVRNAIDNTPKEEFRRRGLKSWETRRNNLKK